MFMNSSDVSRRHQNMAYKDGPITEIIKLFIITIYTYHIIGIQMKRFQLTKALIDKLTKPFDSHGLYRNHSAL